MDLSWLPYSSC